ncbi:MAG: transglycosylase SLT domain-containing protein [Candidatus Sumerlaeaceae bacterium]
MNSTTTEAGDPYISEDLRGVEPGFDADSSFSAAEQEFGVPAALLKALAYAETEMHHGDGSARPGGGRGIMNLRDVDATALTDAAALLQVDKAVLVRDPVQNIRGAAALLRKHYNDAVDAGAHERPWYMALSYYSGKSAEDAVSFGENIRNLLREGFTHTISAGEVITLEPGQDYLLGK